MEDQKGSSLRHVEQWEEYVAANHSKIPAIEEENFLSGTRLVVALDKVWSYYLKSKFRRDTRCFHEKFFNCVLSTVVYRYLVGQGMSCFCPATVIGGVDHASLQLFSTAIGRASRERVD